MSAEEARWTGPNHFREAEYFLSQVHGADLPAMEIQTLMSVAQVHATLALAAVTAELASHSAPPSERTTAHSVGWVRLLNAGALGQEPF